VREAVGGQARWSIDADGMQLGFFSFAKLLMVKDLEPDRWAGGGILDPQTVRPAILASPKTWAIPRRPGGDGYRGLLIEPTDQVEEQLAA
jgi:hypothetical protein